MYARDTARIATPVGMIHVTGDAEHITAIRIGAERTPGRGAETALLKEAKRQIEAWFEGRCPLFDLPLAPAATARGAALRQGMMAIGYGEATSYGALARTLGSSPRAIGQACARNPFPIVVPCHRVTNADGSLGAYSAGAGPATKRWLLDHEQRHKR